MQFILMSIAIADEVGEKNHSILRALSKDHVETEALA